jgi:hypothetical protein
VWQQICWNLIFRRVKLHFRQEASRSQAKDDLLPTERIVQKASAWSQDDGGEKKDLAEETLRDWIIVGKWCSRDPSIAHSGGPQLCAKRMGGAPWGEFRTLIVSQAGHMCSSRVVAYAHKPLQERPFDRVVVDPSR